jgi:hypothetical protein
VNAIAGTTRAGRRGEIYWQPGVLEGDAWVIDEVVTAIVSERQIPLTPVGPWITASLDDATSAYVLLASLFAEIEHEQVPELDLRIPSVPDGAVS